MWVGGIEERFSYKVEMERRFEDMEKSREGVGV